MIPGARLKDGVRELVGLAQDGEELPIELTIQAHVVNGRHIVAGCVRDINDRKQAERMRTLLAKRALLRSDISVA